MSSRIESGFVPLPKVEQEQPEDKIRIALNLPGYVDQDRIGVNLTGIRKLCNLGGIRQLVVLGKTDEETSHVIPEVSGMNSDGSAVASKKMARVTVPTFEARQQHNSAESHDLIAHRWVDLNINMNVDEIGIRASEKKGGVHAAGNWARELDRGVRVSIRRAGNKNLLHNLEVDDKVKYLTQLGIDGIFLSFALLTNWGLAFDSVFIIGTPIYTQIVERIYRWEDPDYRFSITPGFQIDRAIALGITARTRNLIKDLNPDKKPNRF
jgi:hypothetical protein